MVVTVRGPFPRRRWPQKWVWIAGRKGWPCQGTTCSCETWPDWCWMGGRWVRGGRGTSDWVSCPGDRPQRRPQLRAGTSGVAAGWAPTCPGSRATWPDSRLQQPGVRRPTAGAVAGRRTTRCSSCPGGRPPGGKWAVAVAAVAVAAGWVASAWSQGRPRWRQNCD